MNGCVRAGGWGWVLVIASCAVSCLPMTRPHGAAAAKNQMMLVREDPPSFGLQRLLAQARDVPDLASFVSEKGLPDFLAETDDQQRKYLILYYLRNRMAFACRTGLGRSESLEFAGPYPISEGEFQLLDGFQRESARRAADP